MNQPWAVILAAGASSRMGQPKAHLRLGEARSASPSEGGGALAEPPLKAETFLQRIARVAQAAGARPLCVVGPPHGTAILDAGAAGVAWAWNPSPEQGMLSSVQVGLKALPPGVPGALIWPVDVPLVQPGTVQAVLAETGRLAIPTHNGRGGHPIWLPARFFTEVYGLPHAAGLRALRERHAAEITWVPVTDQAVVRDVDTPADLAEIRLPRPGL